MKVAYLYIVKVVLFMVVILFYGCEEHHKLEETGFMSRLDFTETLVSSEKPQQLTIVFQPQINSGFYFINVRFPKFEYDPGNHAMPDASYWEHLIDGMAMKLLDENGAVLTDSELNTIENRRKGFVNAEGYYSVGLRGVPDFQSSKTYKLVIDIPAIHDPHNQFPDMLLRVGVYDPKFYFEHWTR